MTLTAFILIFVSVFLHAGWNFLSKKQSSSVSFFFIANAVSILIWAGFALCSGIHFSDLTGKFWLYFLISSLFEVFYFLGLSCGYRAGDISMVYPMGRALPVILTAVITLLFGIGKSPSAGAVAGMCVIFFGCLLMPLKKLKDFSWRIYCNKLLFFIILIATGTTGYTLFDNLAMYELQKIPAASNMWRTLYYIFIAEIGTSAALGLLVLADREERKECVRLLTGGIFVYLAGFFISLAYALVLLSMYYVNNVSYVQAFRQMSLPLGFLAGVIFLKESCSMPKVIGVLLIVSGLVAVALL